ncbi:MAG: hypothetical protein KBB83_01665 [Alphaproteobacteria bacterium]|nr:hypothetical protein [Alphaproteobacteria bacterium]
MKYGAAVLLFYMGLSGCAPTKESTAYIFQPKDINTRENSVIFEPHTHAYKPTLEFPKTYSKGYFSPKEPKDRMLTQPIAPPPPPAYQGPDRSSRDIFDEIRNKRELERLRDR